MHPVTGWLPVGIIQQLSSRFQYKLIPVAWQCNCNGLSCNSCSHSLHGALLDPGAAVQPDP